MSWLASLAWLQYSEYINMEDNMASYLNIPDVKYECEF